jgi:hypothetical protein
VPRCPCSMSARPSRSSSLMSETSGGNQTIVPQLGHPSPCRLTQCPLLSPLCPQQRVAEGVNSEPWQPLA